MRRAATRWLLLLLCLGATLGPLVGAAAAVQPRTSLTDVENDVMCPSCREPLALAQSPQALAERNFIRTLVAQGLTKRQVEQALLAQYGTAVLAKPPAHGFNLTVYVVPPALLLAGLLVLGVTLPRWRRRARVRAAAEPAPAPPRPPPGEAERLERDLAAFDG